MYTIKHLVGLEREPRRLEKTRLGAQPKAKRRMYLRFFPLLSLFLTAELESGVARLQPESEKEKREQATRREQQLDYYTKWLEEDVVYIITEEEKEVFSKLSNAEERDRFIVQFWFRRDSDPRSAFNEGKEEHYRRIAYANEHFTSGLPGWMSDRGRIYIIHGPPDEVRSYPSGGTYARPMEEGGGTTIVYPFEVWRYRYLQGIGSDVELEFVNKTLTGDYRLAWNPNEKETDPLPLSIHELDGVARGMASRLAESNLQYDPTSLPPKYRPFERYLAYAQAQRPLDIKFKDLKQIVETHTTFNELPFRVRIDMIRLSESIVIAPITVLTSNSDLTFVEENKDLVAKVNVYGTVTSLANRIVAEFEDEIYMQYSASQREGIHRRKSMYQKKVFLDQPGRYKLSLVVKDINSGRVGTTTRAIAAPREMTCSSLILSDRLRRDGLADPNRMFVLGDLYVRPSVDYDFRMGWPVWAYLQIYIHELDQSTGKPTFDISYKIFKGGQILSEITDPDGESIVFSSSERAILVHELYQGLAPGKYRFVVEVKDRIRENLISREASFQIEGS